MAKCKIAILVSGRGANLSAILQESQAAYFPGIVDCVISNNDVAYALQIANKAGIPTFVVRKSALGSYDNCDREIGSILNNRGVDYVCLAGFKRILGEELVNFWANKMLNIHPSLLPSFVGQNGVQQAFEYGVKIAGCTVHFVVPEVDAGPIISQAAVVVRHNDDSDTLTERVLTAELICYPYAILKVLGVPEDILRNKIYMAEARGILLN